MWIDLPSNHSNRPWSRRLICVSVIAFILQYNEVLVVFLLVHRGEGFRGSVHGLSHESKSLLDQERDAAGSPVPAHASTNLQLVVQMLAYLVERATGGPQLDALGHDCAFALIGDLDVDVLAEHRVVP